MSYEPIDDSGRVVKLRKDAPCEWCGQVIAKGDRAVTRIYRFEGDFFSSRQHPECFKAMSDWMAHTEYYWGDGFESGQMVRGKAEHREGAGR